MDSFEGAVARPCPYRARAWCGDRLLGESAGSVRVDVPGAESQLWFPVGAIDLSGFRLAAVEPWRGGTVERFDAEGALLQRTDDARWSSQSQPPIDGVGVARRWVAPPAALAALAGAVVVDHRQLRVELVDAVDGTPARDITTKRFPTWGDASDLVAVLEGDVAISDPARPVVEGSQLLGQAVVAAMRAAPGRRISSAYMMFLRAADARHPVDIELDTVTSGRTFSAFRATGRQGDRVCAVGTLLADAPATDVVHHEPSIADVTGPYDAVPYDMGVTGRDLRVVDGTYTDDPDAPVGPPSIDAWVRFRSLPDDPAIHAGLLAQFTGHMPIAAALRPHAGVGQREAHRTISTAINAIALSFHRVPKMDEWVLYRHHATVVHDGMAHAECRAHDEAGALVASFSVDAMIRPLAPDHSDARTAM